MIMVSGMMPKHGMMVYKMIKKQLAIIVCLSFLFAPIWAAQTDWSNGDTGLVVRTALQANDTELYLFTANNIIGTDTQAYSTNLDSVNQDLANTDSPAFNAMTLTGTNSLALGTFSTTDGMIFFNNATNANTFTIETGVTGAAIGWILPIAVPAGDGYYATFDIDGTINYVAPPSGTGNVSASGTPVINDFAKFVDGTDIEGRSYAEARIDLSIDQTNNTLDEDKPVSNAMLTSLALKGGLADINVWTNTNTFQGTLNIGNINYNAALGTDNTYSGQGITGKNAGETIALWDLVYFDATAGEYLIADTDTVGEWPAWGFATTTGSDGNALTITQDGSIRNDTWAWSAANVPLYLSDTPGGLTETAPSTDGDCIQPVAVTITADIIMINIDPIFGYGESN